MSGVSRVRLWTPPPTLAHLPLFYSPAISSRIIHSSSPDLPDRARALPYNSYKISDYSMKSPSTVRRKCSLNFSHMTPSPAKRTSLPLYTYMQAPLPPGATPYPFPPHPPPQPWPPSSVRPPLFNTSSARGAAASAAFVPGRPIRSLFSIEPNSFVSVATLAIIKATLIGLCGSSRGLES